MLCRLHDTLMLLVVFSDITHHTVICLHTAATHWLACIFHLVSGSNPDHSNYCLQQRWWK